MLNRRPEAVALAAEVGLGDDLVHPATIKAGLWNRGHLVPMPRTLMGVPVDLRGLEGVLSAKGLARAAMDTVLPATELGARDISVGDLVEERLGKEVVDRLVEPLLGGVYAGHAREISARAAVPQLVALLERDRSLTRAAADALPPRTPRWRRSSPDSVVASVGSPAHSRRHPGRRCGRARRSATWPAARTAAGTWSSGPPGSRRWSGPTRSSWPPRPAPPRGCSATWRRARR